MVAILKSYRDPSDPDRAVRIKQPHVPDELYAQVVRSFPIPTVDLTLTGGRKKVLYLARRKVYPASEPWVLGGRIHFNDDTLEDAMVRVLKREIGMTINPKRLAFVSVAYYSWKRTAQGCPGKNISFNFRMEVTDKERALIAKSLVPSEYDVAYGLQEFDRKRLVRERRHPVLVDLFDAIYP